MFVRPAIELSVVTKVGVGLFAIAAALTCWQATRIFLYDAGLVAGAVVESNASVEPNQYNTWNAELQAKEASLRQQQIDLLTTQHERDQRIMAWLFTLAGALLVLILINFYLDFRRYHHRAWTT